MTDETRDELTAEELEAESAELLPEREEMSVLPIDDPSGAGMPIGRIPFDDGIDPAS